jgi:MFS family permease
MIAVGLVALQREFGVSLATSSWLISGFYLAASVGQPLMGRLADRYGPRRVFSAGLAVVAATGVLVLFAPSFGWVVAARVVQAIGTSVGFPAGLAIIRRLAGGRPPAGALGVISAANSTSAAFGPVLGGLLVAAFGWRGIFAVNIPMAVTGLLLARRWLPPDPAPERGVVDPAVERAAVDPALERAAVDSARERAAVDPGGLGGARADIRAVLRDLDLPGIALFTVTITALLGFLLSAGGRPEWALLPVVPVAAALLVWVELRAASPFLDLRELAARPRLVGVLGQQVAVQCAFYLIFFSLPQWLERVRGYPAAATGLLMLPVAALGVLLLPLATRVVRRNGAGRSMLIGSVGLLAGAALLLLVGDRSGAVEIVAIGAVLGLPNAFNNLGLQAALYSAAPAEQAGTAAGLFQTARYVGAILSTALLGIVYGGTPSSAGLHRTALFVVVVAVLLGGAALLMRSPGGGQQPSEPPPSQPRPTAAPAGSPLPASHSAPESSPPSR